MKNQTNIVNKIKDSYCEKQITKLDELKFWTKRSKDRLRYSLIFLA